jgi:undecaprenyl-diphosphatase
MVEAILLGTIQGIAEWLPVSSEGLIVLAQTAWHGTAAGDVMQLIALALFLHLGTTVAALVYFWRDVATILKTLVYWRSAAQADRVLVRFLFVATLVSGVIGVLFLGTLRYVLDGILTDPRMVMGAIGVLLLVTGALQLRTKTPASRDTGELRLADDVTLGIAQGFAALPGLSRSGLTVAALLLRRVDAEVALRLSFLLSIPIVLAGNVAMTLYEAPFTEWSLAPLEAAAAFAAAFFVGLATIHVLLRFARKVNIGKFVIAFGVLTILSTLF